MKIDFTMTGISYVLLAGITLFLLGICLLILQNPIKKIKKFTPRDYIILGMILCFVIVGIVLTTLGIVNAFSLIHQ